MEELEIAAQQKIQHVLFIGDHYTWWECGRSYLCRMIDMLHMGYVDEIVLGREVLTRLPQLAQEWKATYDALKIKVPLASLVQDAIICAPVKNIASLDM